MDQRGRLNGTGAGMMMHRRPRHMKMHMAFYWGTEAEVLFTGWPGFDTRMYALSVMLVFVVAVIVEWLSHCRIMKPGSTGLGPGLVQTAMYTVRCCLRYLVMLAVMSFNSGIFLAGVGGFGVGFFIFGSRTFRNKLEKPSDLPPMTCC